MRIAKYPHIELEKYTIQFMIKEIKLRQEYAQHIPSLSAGQLKSIVSDRFCFNCWKQYWNRAGIHRYKKHLRKPLPRGANGTNPLRTTQRTAFISRRCDSTASGSIDMDHKIPINTNSSVASRTDDEAEAQCGGVLTDRVDRNHRHMQSAISLKGQIS